MSAFANNDDASSPRLATGDEEQHDVVATRRKRLNTNECKVITNNFAALPPTPLTLEDHNGEKNNGKRLKTHECDVIDLTGPDPPAPRASKPTTITIDDDDDDDGDDDEVEIVDAPTQVTPAKSETFARRAGDDDDVQVTGTVNAMTLPHMRCHCTQYPFVENDTLSNCQICDLCYCYVCDVPARACKGAWMSHCNATDKGPRAFYWNSLRRSAYTNEATMLEAHISHGKLFRSAMQTVGKFVKNASLAFYKSGTMRCEVNGSRNTIFLSLLLTRNAFCQYSCNENVNLYLCIADLTRALKSVRNDSQNIMLRATRSVLTVTVQNGNASDQTAIPFRRIARDENVHAPAVYYRCHCRLRSSEFKQIVDRRHKLGVPTCVVAPSSTSKQLELSFRVVDDSNGGLVHCGTITSNDSRKDFELRFRTQPLFHFTRARPSFSHHVRLSLAPSFPMEIEYDLMTSNESSRIGRFQLHVWPEGTSR